MKNSNFAHLHVHDEYSQLDGFGTTKNYVARAKELDFEYLALTNHGNIDGLLKFQRECSNQGIMPVLGCEAYIVPDAKIKPKKEKRGHITILVKNEIGWKELCRLLTYANLEGFHYRPRIDYQSLLDCDLSGFVIMTACAGSFLMDQSGGGGDCFYELCDKMSGRLYFEIMPHDIEVQYELHERIIGMKEERTKAFKIPLVATNDCHYINEDEWKAQEVLLAIQRKAKWNDSDRWSFGFRGLHLRTTDEMIEAFEKQNQFDRKEYLGAMRNTIKIAKECCEFKIPRQDISLPPVISGKSEKEHFDLLKRKVNKLLAERLLVDQGAKERVALELDLIRRKKFAKYFLIVKDLVDWCKKQGIMVGPGRGSVGGSLVAYLLNITQVNPLKYGLLFERFIAEDRIDYPDIDLDFEDIHREKVMQYLGEKYGKNNVSGVSTFSKMKARGVIRDVARVFDVPYLHVDAFAKIINITAKTEERNRNESFISLFSKETEEGKFFERKYSEVTELAIKLEGQVRNSGQHAAAVVISADDLRQGDRGNLCMRKGRVMANWDMEDAEYVGLMKLDILGLNTLTVLNETLRLIQQNHFLDKEISKAYFQDIPLDDKKVFAEINKGNTFGTFQLSAPPTTQLAKEIKIEKFEDIAVIIALVRPGPYDSGMTVDYIKRKKGAKWKKKHPIYEEITKDTYGILVFQEQVMKVISEVAGLSYSVSDKVRKVIAKKRDVEGFKKYWDMFLKGCLKNKTMNKQEAEEFWEGLQKWASYGFNQAHSIEYSLLAYWTSWFKFYYPLEFICAHLTYGTQEDKNELIGAVIKLGFELTPPKVGISDSHKWVAKDNKLHIPFIEVKGIGNKTAIQCSQKKTIKRKQIGFFDTDDIEPVTKAGSALDKLLRQIGSYGNEFDLSEAQESFSFSLSGDKRDLYPNLYSLLGFDFSDSDLQYYLSLDDRINTIPKPVIRRRRFLNKKVLDCEKCELKMECRKPVLPSQGIYNVAIIGEGPGPQEDREGRGFYEEAPAGELLWDTLSGYGYKRSFFHVTNVCKCYPGRKIKTPTKVHIKVCLPWLHEELDKIDCRLALMFGNTGVKAFTDKDSGITDMSGKTEWNEKLGLWMCWCMHPASVKHNPGNKRKFVEGIENFVNKLEMLK